MGNGIFPFLLISHYSVLAVSQGQEILGKRYAAAEPPRPLGPI